MADQRSPFGDNPLTTGQPLAQVSPFGDSPWSAEKSAAEDVANLAPSALRTGLELIPAGPGETSSLAPALIRKLIELMPWTTPETLADFDKSYQASPASTLPGLSDIREWVTDPLFGESNPVEATTTPGRYAKSMIEEAPSALFNPGSLMSKGAQWLGGSVGSEGAGQLAERYQDQLPSWAPDAARMAGGIGGSMSPQAFNKASNPNPIPPFRKPQIEVLKSKNVPISAGQMTGSKKLMMKEDIAGAFPENQMEEFTRASMDTQGGFPKGTPRAERKVMKAELERMGGEFDHFEATAAVPFDQTLQDALLDATISYVEDNPTIAKVVESTMNDLSKNASATGTLSGAAYKNMRTKLNKLIGNENADPGVTGALIDMKDALDDALERSLSPSELARYKKVRQQYRDYLPIERAKAAAGQGAAEGQINPKQLKTGVKAVEGKREIASGSRPMTELAEAGEAVLERPPSSGTAERARNQLSQMIALLSTGGGAAAGQLLQSGPLTALLAGIGGAGAIGYPMARDAFIRSDAGQKFLGRQGPRIDTGTKTQVGSGSMKNPTVQALQQIQRDTAQMTDEEKRRMRLEAGAQGGSRGHR